MRFLLFWLTLLPLQAMDSIWTKGMTISCQGYGREWGTDLFAEELDKLKEMGVNSVTIHPYARINEDGSVTWRPWPKDKPPHYFVRPIREAHARGMTIMIKPHLAYWGSSFSWRGDIRFEDPEQRARFFDTYHRWIVEMARITSDADTFVVGTELKHFVEAGDEWSRIIKDIRSVTKARLTYAANWDTFDRVAFWKHLDVIGIQGYFPITNQPNPDKKALLAGWRPIINNLRSVSKREGKPVVFTEFGYNRSLQTAKEPWSYNQDQEEQAENLQALCLKVGLEVLEAERQWFHGAYLWKWFAGPAPYANFKLDTPKIRAVIERAWK